MRLDLTESQLDMITTAKSYIISMKRIKDMGEYEKAYIKLLEGLLDKDVKLDKDNIVLKRLLGE